MSSSLSYNDIVVELTSGGSIGDKELILVKWWRADNKGGKSAWVNIKSAEVLIAQPEDVDMKSKSRRRQSTGDISSRRSLDDK